MGQLAAWRAQNWKRIDSKGNIAGECGTSKDTTNADRCLPESKAKSLTKEQRRATAQKKKKEGKKGKTVVANTSAAKVRQTAACGGYTQRWSKARGK